MKVALVYWYLDDYKLWLIDCSVRNVEFKYCTVYITFYINSSDVGLFLAEITLNKQEKLHNNWWIERCISLQMNQFLFELNRHALVSISVELWIWNLVTTVFTLGSVNETYSHPVLMPHLLPPTRNILLEVSVLSELKCVLWIVYFKIRMFTSRLQKSRGSVVFLLTVLIFIVPFRHLEDGRNRNWTKRTLQLNATTWHCWLGVSMKFSDVICNQFFCNLVAIFTLWTNCCALKNYLWKFASVIYRSSNVVKKLTTGVFRNYCGKILLRS